jgi:hypothetical protein
MAVEATNKSFSEKTKKNDKKRRLFSIPKPIPIPTENRHFSKKPIPIPTDCQKLVPQGSSRTTLLSLLCIKSVQIWMENEQTKVSVLKSKDAENCPEYIFMQQLQQLRWGGIHQMLPQFFYDYSFYNYSPSQSGCTKFFHTRKNCGKIVEKL